MKDKEKEKEIENGKNEKEEKKIRMQRRVGVEKIKDTAYSKVDIVFICYEDQDRV